MNLAADAATLMEEGDIIVHPLVCAGEGLVIARPRP